MKESHSGSRRHVFGRGGAICPVPRWHYCARETPTGAWGARWATYVHHEEGHGAQTGIQKSTGLQMLTASRPAFFSSPTVRVLGVVGIIVRREAADGGREGRAMGSRDDNESVRISSVLTFAIIWAQALACELTQKGSAERGDTERRWAEGARGRR